MLQQVCGFVREIAKMLIHKGDKTDKQQRKNENIGNWC